MMESVRCLQEQKNRESVRETERQMREEARERFYELTSEDAAQTIKAWRAAGGGIDDELDTVIQAVSGRAMDVWQATIPVGARIVWSDDGALWYGTVIELDRQNLVDTIGDEAESRWPAYLGVRVEGGGSQWDTSISRTFIQMELDGALWAACEKAGFPKRLHDFLILAVRNPVPKAA